MLDTTEHTITPKPFEEQQVPTWNRAVLKVGSSLLAANDGGLSTRHVLGLAQFIASSHAAGREVVLVSSGAVAAGRMLLADHADQADASNAARQAMAALGQTQTVALWQRLFDRPLAQVLLTHDDMRNRRRYLNARTTLQELLKYGVLPVVNENDTVAVDELTLGDNDNLAALVAGLVDADVLIIATDINGLYDANPHTHPDAKPINEVIELTPEIIAAAGGSDSLVGTGGMSTKLEAAKKAAAAGIDTFLVNGRDGDALRLLSGDRLRGTRLRSTRTKLQARKYWLRHSPASRGAIVVDEGAERALVEHGASLLPPGVTGARGDFQRGDVVAIEVATSGQVIARGLTQYGADELRQIHGRHTREIDEILGYSHGDTVVHRDDLVTVDKRDQTPEGTSDE